MKNDLSKILASDVNNTTANYDNKSQAAEIIAQEKIISVSTTNENPIATSDSIKSTGYLMYSAMRCQFLAGERDCGSAASASFTMCNDEPGS